MKHFIILAALSSAFANATNYFCTELGTHRNEFVGTFKIEVTNQGANIKQVEYSTARLADIATSNIQSLRKDNTFSKSAEEDERNAAAYNFDFLADPDPYDPAHPPRKYKGYSRYKPAKPKNEQAFNDFLRDMIHIVVRPEIAAGEAIHHTDDPHELPDVAFQYSLREDGAADYFNCF